MILTEQLERSNQIIKKYNSKIIKKAHRKIQRVPSQRDIYSKLQALSQFSTTFYKEVDLLKKQFRNDFKKEQSIQTLERLFEKAQHFQKQAIQLVAISWDDGGIKGSIFADITKKQICLKQLKTDLGTPLLEWFLPYDQKTYSLAIFLTQLNHLQNHIRCQENILVRFFVGQIFTYCGYDHFDVYAVSKKPSIRLGETYEAGICFGNYTPIPILTVSVDKDSLSIINNAATYQRKPTNIGEQAYKVALTFKHPISRKIERREQLFYFEVH